MKFDRSAIIIGSGAAGYAAAEQLYRRGVTDICVVTENRLLSTSRCSGSDKQTYYKLDIASDSGDSVLRMARDLFAGGSMNGSDALTEAAGSIRGFMHLCEIGVPFPRDEYGIYQGYRTDHDNTKRATSCGPLTSKYMTEMLEKAVEGFGIPILDGCQVTGLLVSDGVCYGIHCLMGGRIKKITAPAVILCTGAPAAIYADSVYPVGHRGATGLAIEAGAKLRNFQEWQYGIATTSFRWNLSGSFQQVIPRYISVDEKGNASEFLSGVPDVFTKIFLKGYEWPFNSRKTEGSSLIDIMVSAEKAKGNRVYLDFTENPQGFDFSLLGEEARSYLEKAGVGAATPYERLLQLNPAAARLYLDNGIDLSEQPAEIGVCAQHNNGGIAVDKCGETSIRGLFASGECSGRFGVYRPGGAALNDTQVGALVISEELSRRFAQGCGEMPELSFEAALPPVSDKSNIDETDLYFARRMSLCAGAKRTYEQLAPLTCELEELAEDFYGRVTVSSEEEYGKFFALYHTTLARLALCRTELASLEKIGSRGGCICIRDGKIIPENEEYRAFLTVTSADGVSFERVDEIPATDCVFENLLKK